MPFSEEFPALIESPDPWSEVSFHTVWPVICSVQFNAAGLIVDLMLAVERTDC